MSPEALPSVMNAGQLSAVAMMYVFAANAACPSWWLSYRGAYNGRCWAGEACSHLPKNSRYGAVV